MSHAGDTELLIAARAALLDALDALDDAMTKAGFHRDLTYPQPGSWLSPTGIPVDLMVPEALAGGGVAAARGSHHTAATPPAARPASKPPSSTTRR